ncbi:Cysteine-rich receptor protein kinase 25 [Spatholobus suberectus]|nr:Cysteine-rich receptor protein kinase 25 [Spatholobus suberectus]
MLVSSDYVNVTSCLVLSMLAIGSFTSSLALTYNDNYCPNNTTPQFNTAFQTNLRILLSSLNSNASLGLDDSYQTTIGSPNPDAASGVFLCRGDISAATCKECVATAATEITRRCHNQTKSIIWYDECMVAHTPDWFDPAGVDPRANLWDNKSVPASDLESFNQTLFGLLNGLAEEAAASSQSKPKFATEEAGVNIGSSRRVYGLAQCVPSSSNTQCEECLRNGIGTLSACCEGKQGARALLAWCNIRYELYQFYNTIGTSTSPLVPSPPSGKNSGPRKVVLIAVPVSLSIILLFFVCYFLLGRTRKNCKIRLLRENFGDESATFELLQFNLATIEAATNKFSYENKIGKGGFGEVYKVTK